MDVASRENWLQRRRLTAGLDNDRSDYCLDPPSAPLGLPAGHDEADDAQANNESTASGVRSLALRLLLLCFGGGGEEGRRVVADGESQGDVEGRVIGGGGGGDDGGGQW